MSTRVHLDPVADGKPHRSKVLMGATVLLVAMTVYQIHLGNYTAAMDDGSTAVLIYLIDAVRRWSWEWGYDAAATSAKQQVERID